MVDPVPELTDAWRAHRRYLLAVAFRMVGNIGDAEDVVQEAFARLVRADIEEIADVRGWLVVVVTRLCLNQLNSAHHRHGAGREPPETPDFADPADRATLDDSIQLALLVVLERLSPAERATFVLHDVFQLPFDDIATMLGRSPAACRQVASRARRRIHSEGPGAPCDVDPADQRHLAERFIDACGGGDMEALMRILAPDVVARYDAGGRGPGMTMVGTELFGALWDTFAPLTLVPVPITGYAGVLAFRRRRLFAVLLLTEKEGLITEIQGISDPSRLAAISAVVGVRR